MCVSRTHNSERCLKMYGHQWSQAITAFATKACELVTKSHMLDFCKGLCRDMLWQWSIETNNARKKKISCLPEKKSKAKNNDDVRKVVISDKMHEKNFCFSKRRAKPKTKNNDDFRKVVIFDIMQRKKKNFCPPKKRAMPKKINDGFRKIVISDKMQEKRISVLRKKRAKLKQK